MVCHGFAVCGVIRQVSAAATVGGRRAGPDDEGRHLVVAADDGPRDPDAQVEWLYDRWAQVDAWIGARTG